MVFMNGKLKTGIKLLMNVVVQNLLLVILNGKYDKNVI